MLGTGLRDILLGHLGLDIFDLFEKPELAEQIDGPALERLVDDLLEILIGGLGGLVPERKKDIARLGLRALVASTLANFSSACVAGALL